jgi:DNA-binding CsgD family transcriptional regulator
VSGRRRYVCRLFILNHRSGKLSHAIKGLLVERRVAARSEIAMANQFRLTPREQETIKYLMLGLTSKEIATQMEISPHTVNTFFRNIRSKMAVSTRSGIIGKIVGTRSRGAATRSEFAQDPTSHECMNKKEGGLP